MTGKDIEKRFAAYVVHLQKVIKEQGWIVQPVFALEGEIPPSFAYTIGLHKTFNHPEIALFGFAPEYMQEMLNTLALHVKNKGPLPVNVPFEGVYESVAVFLIPVLRRQQEFFKGFSTFYSEGEDPPVLQLVIPDKNGLFPWQEGCDEKNKALQILLGDPPALH